MSGGGAGSDEQIQRLTLTTLTEFFAAGIIENEAIYKEIMLGKVKDVRDIESLGQIVVNWDGYKNSNESSSSQASQQPTNISYMSTNSSAQPQNVNFM